PSGTKNGAPTRCRLYVTARDDGASRRSSSELGPGTSHTPLAAATFGSRQGSMPSSPRRTAGSGYVQSCGDGEGAVHIDLQTGSVQAQPGRVYWWRWCACVSVSQGGL